MAVRDAVLNAYNQHAALVAVAEAAKIRHEGRHDSIDNWHLLNNALKALAAVRAGQPAVASVDHRPLVDALMKIASWSEGDEVSGHFDEPSSATIARKALAAVGIVGGVK